MSRPLRIIPINSQVFGNVRPRAQQVRSSGDLATAEISESLQDQIDQMFKAISSFSVTVAITPSSATVAEQILVPGSTTTVSIAAPTTPGDSLSVYVQAKGPTALLAWGSMFKWAPTEFDSTTDTWTLFEFSARKDPSDLTMKWFSKGPPTQTGAPS